jgi:hypothetical protein
MLASLAKPMHAHALIRRIHADAPVSLAEFEQKLRGINEVATIGSKCKPELIAQAIGPATTPTNKDYAVRSPAYLTMSSQKNAGANKYWPNTTFSQMAPVIMIK